MVIAIVAGAIPLCVGAFGRDCGSTEPPPCPLHADNSAVLHTNAGQVGLATSTQGCGLAIIAETCAWNDSTSPVVT